MTNARNLINDQPHFESVKNTMVCFLYLVRYFWIYCSSTVY